MSATADTASQSFRIAVQAFQAGRLVESQAKCQQILGNIPHHAGALHLLGIIVGRSGDLDRAIDLVSQAVSAEPDFLPGHVTLGQLYTSKNNLPKAVESYHRAAMLRPDDPVHWYSLGIVQRMNKRLDAGISSFQRVLHLNPTHAEAHTELAGLLRKKGRSAEALRSFAAAVALRPNSPEMQSNYGTALMDAGRLNEAESAYRRAIELSPTGAVYHANLGELLMKSYNYEKALEEYATATALDPKLWRALAGRGTTLARMNRFAEALAEHEHALRLAPDEPDLHVSLAWVLTQMGRVEAAEQHCRLALERDNESAAAWHTLGSALRAIGRFDEATAAFRRSIDLCPSAAVYMLWSATLQDATTAEADRLLAFSRLPELSWEDRACAEFSLGKIFDDSDRFDEAFEHFKIGNELVKGFWAGRGVSSEVGEFRQTVSRMKETFTRDFFDSARDWGDPTDAPVFIVGMPRSGTSLVEQIAASHSQVFGAGELTDISTLTAGLRRQTDAAGRFEFNRSQSLFAAEEYKRKILSLGGSATRVIDKMPGNIAFLGFIATFFPNSRVIFCNRDPRDNCLSCYFQRFTKDHLMFSYDLVDCAQRYLEQMKLQAHWEQVLPLKMMTIQYESLVADLEGQSRRLIEFLGLPWEPKCLDFHNTDRVVLTASFRQVRQPIYTRSVGRWKQYEKHLTPLLDMLR